MKSVEIVSEEIIPLDLWEQFCAKYGAKPELRVYFDGDKLKEYDDGSRRFILNVSFLGAPNFFVREPEMFMKYMEQTFHDGVRRAVSQMREELNILRSKGQKTVI